MVRYIVKPDPDTDYYACFCTIVGDFLYGGPRSWWDTRLEPERGEHAPERFERADLYGTSAYPYPEDGGRKLAWDETSIFLNRGMSEGWMLARSDVIEYARCNRAGEPVDDLLTPERGDPTSDH